MKAFAYLRTSTDRQELSPLAQLEQVTAYCRMRGYDLVGHLDETGVSGCVEFAKRPRGAELLQRLAEFDVVVFARLDRAFRSTVDAILTVQKLAAAGKTIVFLDLNIDTATPAGMLCLQMMSAFAEFEQKRIGERITDALAQAKKQGKKIGPAPFGSRNAAVIVDGRKVNGGLHEKVDEEELAMKTIYDLRFESVPATPIREIADRLTAARIPTRGGGRWCSSTVGKIVKRMEVVNAAV